jgi:hypothetical protein
MRHTFPHRHRTFPPLAQPRALLVFCPPVEQNRTVFFWAPVAKWGLVAAGIKDLQRPADKLSLTQNLALAATGFIWVSGVVEVEMAGRRRLPTSYPASHLSAEYHAFRSPCVSCGVRKVGWCGGAGKSVVQWIKWRCDAHCADGVDRGGLLLEARRNDALDAGSEFCGRHGRASRAVAVGSSAERVTRNGLLRALPPRRAATLPHALPPDSRRRRSAVTTVVRPARPPGNLCCGCGPGLTEVEGRRPCLPPYSHMQLIIRASL